jgi:hypothetical protein
MDVTPPPGFKPRFQESTSGFSPAGDTGSATISGLPPAGGTEYDGVAATSSPQGPLPVPSLLFSKSKETIPFLVCRPETGYGIPAPSSLRGAGYQPSAHQYEI